MTDSRNGTLSAINDALVMEARKLARMCREQGERLEKALNDYADQQESSHENMSSAVLTSHRDMLEDVQAFIGTSRITTTTRAIENELKGMTKQ